MNTTKVKKGDVLINFKDLFIYIIARWRSVLAVAIVLTVLACGYKYMSDKKAYDAAVAGNSQALELSDDADGISTANINTVMACKQAYKKYADYVNDGLIFKIDANKVPTANLVYTLTGEDRAADTIAYAKALDSDELYAKIAEAIGADVKAAYISDLIETKTQLSDEQSVINNADQSAALNVTIKGVDEQMCKTITAQVKSHVSKLAIGQAELTTDSYVVRSDYNLRRYQMDCARECNDLRTAYVAANAELSTEELNYLTSLENESDDTQPQPVSISKKFAVLGFGGGFVMMCLLWLLVYLFDKRIKSEDDILDRFDVHLFGTVNGGRSKGANRFANGMYKRSIKKLDVVGKQIAMAITTADVSKIGVFGELESVEMTAQSVKTYLDGSDVELAVSASPFNDTDAMSSFERAQAIVLVQKAGVSTSNEVSNLLELCQMHGKKVLGILLVR